MRGLDPPHLFSISKEMARSSPAMTIEWELSPE
jgi:hypothetical protein